VSQDSPADLPDVDVIIVAHNAGAYLEAAVASVEEQVGNGRVVLVDAESADGSVEAVSTASPTTRVITAPNRGFSASNNLGIAATSGEFVLLLNPDAELEPRSLSILVERAHSDARIGMVAPRILNADGSMQRGSFGSFPTLASTLALQIGRRFDRLRGGVGLAASERRISGQVDWVTGAAMLVRRAAIVDVGPMDEGFFLYFEDVEWCHRMRDRGWEVVIEPGASCVHHLGKAGGGPVTASRAYRESFYRYCRIYRLWGLAIAARVGLTVRAAFGGRG
jgi:N-acetylglucosaminyl-diphospho-decaprenol L-rhamnosyltransferase